ncbi:MAG: flagella basal body P-ring formation protein FlgA [Leptospiraceae bacterium]|nr:flagella basal body P-ring formation protein FlgA [Leptospiraceae bacterium]MCP5500360.1 flagella basal body P-ring formation protein FlgA [Leptospiraceae bacterium]
MFYLKKPLKIRLLLLLFLNLPLYSTEIIALKTKVFISRNAVYLRDVAKIRNTTKDKALFKTPDTPVFLTKEDLLATYPEDEQKNLQIAGSSCLLIPLNRNFTANELENSLKAEIIKRNDINHENIKVKSAKNDLLLPGKGIEYRWANFPDKIAAGYRIFSLNLFFEGRKIHSERIKFEVSVKQTLPVSTRTISKGEELKLGENYIIQDIFSADTHSKKYLQNTLNRYITIRQIPEHSIIEGKYLRKTYLVENGKDTEFLYKHKGIRIIGKARAYSSGNQGERVKLRLKNGKKFLWGRVFDKNKVELE